MPKIKTKNEFIIHIQDFIDYCKLEFEVYIHRIGNKNIKFEYIETQCLISYNNVNNQY